MTHVEGLRPFGSQLLCEQVVGRALRRTSYVVDPEAGLFTEETWSHRRWTPRSAQLLVTLTTTGCVGTITNMKATLVARTRIVYDERAFAELVLWRVPTAVVGSSHEFKYRLAYVVDGVCVVRYDNEVGKGDHRHFGDRESVYSFNTPEALLAAFERDIARWNRENSDSRGSRSQGLHD